MRLTSGSDSICSRPFRGWRRVGAVVLAATLVASACGSDDGPSAAGADAETPPTSAASATAANDATATTAATPVTTAEEAEADSSADTGIGTDPEPATSEPSDVNETDELAEPDTSESSESSDGVDGTSADEPDSKPAVNGSGDTDDTEPAETAAETDSDGADDTDVTDVTDVTEPDETETADKPDADEPDTTEPKATETEADTDGATDSTDTETDTEADSDPDTDEPDTDSDTDPEPVVEADPAPLCDGDCAAASALLTEYRDAGDARKTHPVERLMGRNDDWYTRPTVAGVNAENYRAYATLTRAEYFAGWRVLLEYPDARRDVGAAELARIRGELQALEESVAMWLDGVACVHRFYRAGAFMNGGHGPEEGRCEDLTDGDGVTYTVPDMPWGDGFEAYAVVALLDGMCTAGHMPGAPTEPAGWRVLTHDC